MKERLVEIDILQGMAMLLVVLGHHWLDFMPDWYHHLHYYLYLFHMPLFIFISGFLIRYSYKGVDNLNEYKTYVFKRVKKFIPMYFFVGILCIFLSTDIKNPLVETYDFINLMIDPKASPATFLWYIYMLFVYYCLAPLLFRLSKGLLTFIFILSILGFIFPSENSLFCIDYFTKYSVFFLFGVLVASRYDDFRCFLKKTYLTFLLFFIFLSIFHFNIDYCLTLEKVIPWIAIPAFGCITLWVHNSYFLCKFFTYISIHCFSIYLFHMFFVQAIAVVIEKNCSNFSTLHYILYLMMSIFVSIMCSSKIYSLLKRILPLD